MIAPITPQKPTIVVIGHGMVGHRFCEKIVEFDSDRQYHIVTFCEEPRPAYDRVGLTSFFDHRSADKLMLARLDWYNYHGIELHVGDRAEKIDRDLRVVTSARGVEVPYDHVILATGSYPFVPPVPGIKQPGVFVYRTIEDLEQIIEYGKNARTAAVIGGGLLGLEAAKATHDLGLKTHVVEFAPRLMPRQVDEAGSRILKRRIEELGVSVHLNKRTESILGSDRVTGISFVDGPPLDVDIIVVSAGIRPRDELAGSCGLRLGQRGGVEVDDVLSTSDPSIYAIGEVALHRSMVYGLVAPGYDMAETVAANLCGKAKVFTGSDMSTKLKLMGVDVASFGDYEQPPEKSNALTFEDPIKGVYKRLFFSKDGTRIEGGILVGDASDYSTLSAFAKSDQPLPVEPSALIGVGGGSSLGGADALPEEAQVCSCNNVSKAAICGAIANQDLRSMDAVKTCTNAGTGCGGCLPLVTQLFKSEMEKAGVTLTNHICEHFPLSRQELFHSVRVKGLRTFAEILAECGTGRGCEVCKPTVASIIASLWNEHVFDHGTLQDTNDRFMANIQRTGLYSVVPRVPGGEITPDKLIVLGQVAKKYDLYTKITGGQRVDLFGARMDQLPDIWSELIDAGFESGHAYGKALRTVKSCVGSTWCRYGMQDSVGFAIRVEERYRGIRAPHKIKGGVSGCARECAEAQSKDFGIIATDKGWNLYICGNGGATPRHADLFASDLDDETCIKYLDRFLMFYIHTADKLTRTVKWLGTIEGGIEYLREVIIEDSLGICEQLEADIQRLISTYKCEWKEVVDNPEKRAQFSHFTNDPKGDDSIEWVMERGQSRPKDWARDRTPPPKRTRTKAPKLEWIHAGSVNDYPEDGGRTFRYGHHQIAIYYFTARDKWFATQNQCPHQRDMVLSRGLLGEAGDTPKVACPMHKKTFSLETGEGLSDPDYSISTFSVRIIEDEVFVELPPLATLDELDIAASPCQTAQSCSGCASTSTH